MRNAPLGLLLGSGAQNISLSVVVTWFFTCLCCGWGARTATHLLQPWLTRWVLCLALLGCALGGWLVLLVLVGWLLPLCRCDHNAGCCQS